MESRGIQQDRNADFLLTLLRSSILNRPIEHARLQRKPDVYLSEPATIARGGVARRTASLHSVAGSPARRSERHLRRSDRYLDAHAAISIGKCFVRNCCSEVLLSHSGLLSQGRREPVYRQ